MGDQTEALMNESDSVSSGYFAPANGSLGCDSSRRVRASQALFRALRTRRMNINLKIVCITICFRRRETLLR